MLVRPLLKNALHLEGSFIAGPWNYRVIMLSSTMTAYSFIQVVVGTILGEQQFFLRNFKRVWGLIIPALRDKE